MAGKQGSGDSLAANLAVMSKTQLYDIMCQMKSLIEQNQQQARQILIQNPLLTRALFQAQILLGMVQPSQAVPNIQPQLSQHASPSVQQANVRAAHSTPSLVGMQDQANVSQTIPVRKQQQNQPPMPISSTLAQAIPSQSVSSQPVEQPRGHANPQATQIPHPLSSQVPNMPSVPLHQPPMLPMLSHLQQPNQVTGISHHMQQPPPPPQPRPPIQMQYQPPVGSNANFQNVGIPQHHSQPLYHSGNRPSPGMGQFSHGQPPLTAQPSHQPMYQGGGSLLGTDHNNQVGSSMQMDRGSPWPPTSRENASGAQLPTLPPLAPGPMSMGNQARPPPPPLTPDVEQALLQQVMSLTPEQINLLPPEQRHQVLQLQQMLRQ